MTTNNPDNTIRISKDEALSTHVDDMLKRQMSMRGDPGVTRDRSRAWFYQNWFVFGLVGLMGALAAWAVLEPSFSDYLYIQGAVTSATDFENVNRSRLHTDRDEEFADNFGAITIKGEKILLVDFTRELTKNRGALRVDPGSIKIGDEIGVYVEYREGGGESLSAAVFIVRSPAPQSASRAALTLHQLQARKTVASLLLFPLVAGFIDLFIGAADGLVCRVPRRALICGLVGLFVGFVGGFVSSILANAAYSPLHYLAMKQAGTGGLSSMGFMLQMIGRSLAWCFAGSAMGLAQGIALRSKRLLIYGLLGGVVGGLLGGLLFDPIDLVLLGPDKPSAALSRLIGFGVIGLSVGATIGIVELLARDAWLRMTQGPLTGKEFLIFKDVMNIGSSPRSDIYLFNDAQVAENHATLRAIGDECEIEARQSASPVLLNNRSVTRARLRHGDNVTIGRTSFVFQQRKS
jgi:Inner membrane component of T3SS, cytoplasmic domain